MNGIIIGGVRRIGTAWEGIKAFAVVLWPIRFILFVIIVTLLLLQVDQAQNVLFSVFQENTKSPLVFFLLVVFWAGQAWYWGRFLYYVSCRTLPTPFFSPPSGQRPVWVDVAESQLPRILGLLVFFGVAASVWHSGQRSEHNGTDFWSAALVVGGIAFYALVYWRREYLRRTQPGLRPKVIPLPQPKYLLLAGILGLGWIILLAFSIWSSWWAPWGDAWPHGAVVLIVMFVLLPLSGSIWLVSRLPLGTDTRAAVITLAVVNAALFLASVFAPVWAGTLFGPGAILMLVAASWTGTTTFFLAYPGETLRLPVTGLLLVAMLAGGWVAERGGGFDNHTIRGSKELLSDTELGERVNLKTAFSRWYEQAPCYDARGPRACVGNESRPLVLVAAQGGASRAAYWTALVLGTLQDSNPCFAQSVFALSGVSGGSLGLAVFHRLLDELNPPRTAGPCRFDASDSRASYASRAQEILRRDFLGATFFSMFNADIVQRLLPGAFLPDRARALEQAWETAWKDVMVNTSEDRIKGNSFAAEFAFRSDEAGKRWLPVLLLNGTSVKTGRRIITSDIAIVQGCKPNESPSAQVDFPDAVDFFCLTRRNMPLSTAVHNSARFPYVSPAGTVWATDGKGYLEKTDRIVDGGYFETYGATTLSDVAGLVEHMADGRNVRIIVLSIENDPMPHKQPSTLAKAMAAPEADPMPFNMKILPDALSPPLGLAASRSGRGSYAAANLREQLHRGHFGKDEQQRALYFSLRLLSRPAPDKAVDPAMSWYLSQRSLRAMDKNWCDSIRGRIADFKASSRLAADKKKDLGNESEGDIADALDRFGQALGMTSDAPLIAGEPEACKVLGEQVSERKN